MCYGSLRELARISNVFEDAEQLHHYAKEYANASKKCSVYTEIFRIFQITTF